MNNTTKQKLNHLISLMLEGKASDAQAESLYSILSDSPKAVDHYVESMSMISCLLRADARLLSSFNDNAILQEGQFDIEMWQALAEYERTAPETIIPKVEPPRELIQKVVYPKMPPRHVNKCSLYTAIISIAAMAFAIIYVQFAPLPATTVATITDSIDAQWAQSKHPTEIGSELWNNEGTRWLHKGIVKIEFDYGAEVIIEGPTAFEMKDEEKMVLHSGRLYATVPKNATGFTVQTPYSTIIDLGTEFGVKVDVDGTTDVHMTKGKALLIPGTRRKKGESRELAAGQANRVDTTGEVAEIQIRERSFVRKVDSETGFLWRGEDLNLADIVGGGNGFGTGHESAGIVPHTGEFVSNPKQSFRIIDLPDFRFAQVPELKFVDGVFVPHTGVEGIEVTSEGHIFKGCPVVDGTYRGKHISNGYRATPLYLRGIAYGPQGRPAINMQRNKGITFDLDAIRQSLPDAEIVSFRALFSFCDATRKDYKQNAEDCNQRNKKMRVSVYVLVDGKEHFSRKGVTIFSEPTSIQVELSPDDRFLTLVTAYEKIGAHNLSFFADPILELE